MKKIILSVLILCLAFVTGASSFASSSSKSLSELKRERDEINAIVSNLESSISATEIQMYRTELEILELDERLTVAYEELQVINETLDGTLVRLDEAELELENSQMERDNQFDAFRSRLRVMHEYGEISFIEVLFNAASIRDFLARLQYLNDVAAHDQTMVERLTEAEDNVSVKVEDIARQRNTIESLQFKQKELTVEFENTLDEKNRYMAALETDMASYAATLEAERVTQRQVTEVYDQAVKEDAERRRQEELARIARQRENSAALIASFNGEMTWPVPVFNRITDVYGDRIHPITKRNDFHTGVDIAASSGNDIVAAMGGVVISSGWQGSYGNCVIVDHGNGFSTLYAHASQLVANNGDRVTAGQVIAKIGSTGRSTGPHLHFEVRAGGVHTNPRPFLGY